MGGGEGVEEGEVRGEFVEVGGEVGRAEAG